MEYDKENTLVRNLILVWIFTVGVAYNMGIQLEVDPILLVMPAVFLILGNGAIPELKNTYVFLSQHN